MDNIESQHVSPFGIHSIAQVGVTYRRKPGDWYGPQAICNVLHEINKTMKPLTNFSMVVCNDGNVFLDKIAKKINKDQRKMTKSKKDSKYDILKISFYPFKVDF